MYFPGLQLGCFSSWKMMFSPSCAQKFAQNGAFCASFKRKITRLFFEHHMHTNSQAQNGNHTAAYSYSDLSTQQIPAAYPVSHSSVLPHSLDAILPDSPGYMLPHSRWICFATLSRLRSRSFSVAPFSLTLSAPISLTLSISVASLSLPQHNRLNAAC